MIYVETTVALAQLLAEDRCPPESLWNAPVVSSRLTEYEAWTGSTHDALAARTAKLSASFLGD
jgi:hypothetical protein